MKMIFPGARCLLSPIGLLVLLCQMPVAMSEKKYPMCYRGSIIDDGEGAGVRHPGGDLIVTLTANNPDNLDVKVQSTRRDRISNYKNISILHTAYRIPNVFEAKSGDDPNGGSHEFLETSSWVIPDDPGDNLYFLHDIADEYGWHLKDRLTAFRYDKYQNKLYAHYNDSVIIFHPISCFGFPPSSGFVYLTKSLTGYKNLRAYINITTPSNLTLVASATRSDISKRYSDLAFDWARVEGQPMALGGDSNIYYDYRIRLNGDGGRLQSSLKREFDWELPEDDYQFFFNSSRQEIYTHYSGETVTLVAHKCKNLNWDHCRCSHNTV